MCCHTMEYTTGVSPLLNVSHSIMWWEHVLPYNTVDNRCVPTIQRLPLYHVVGACAAIQCSIQPVCPHYSSSPTLSCGGSMCCHTMQYTTGVSTLFNVSHSIMWWENVLPYNAVYNRCVHTIQRLPLYHVVGECAAIQRSRQPVCPHYSTSPTLSSPLLPLQSVYEHILSFLSNYF